MPQVVNACTGTKVTVSDKMAERLLKSGLWSIEKPAKPAEPEKAEAQKPKTAGRKRGVTKK